MWGNGEAGEYNAVGYIGRHFYISVVRPHIYSFDLTTDAAFSQRPFLSSPGSPSYMSLSTAREFIYENERLMPKYRLKWP